MDHLQKSWSLNEPLFPKETGYLKDSRGPGLKDSSEMLKNYKGLKAWQKSHQLCLEIHRASTEFPKEERIGLTSQRRQVVVSVVSNITEGQGRKTTTEYTRLHNRDAIGFASFPALQRKICPRLPMIDAHLLCTFITVFKNCGSGRRISPTLIAGTDRFKKGIDTP